MGFIDNNEDGNIKSNTHTHTNSPFFFTHTKKLYGQNSVWKLIFWCFSAIHAAIFARIHGYNTQCWMWEKKSRRKKKMIKC